VYLNKVVNKSICWHKIQICQKEFFGIKFCHINMIQSTIRFLKKSVSIILLLILGFFGVGNFVVSSFAQISTTDPVATKPATATAKPTDSKAVTTPTTGANTAATATPTLQYQTDPAIGGLKNCNATSAPDDPTGASKFISDCVKNIMELVVGISVILAIMSLVFLGIRSLNSFESQSAVNKEVVERIQGFTVGAVILGLFSAIIGTLNPAALNINEIFGGQVAREIRAQVDRTKINPFGSGGDSLGLGGDSKTGAAADGAGANGGTTTGGGATGGSRPYTAEEVGKILNDEKQKTQLIKDLVDCEKIISSTFIDTSKCAKILSIPATELTKVKQQSGYIAALAAPNNINAGTFILKDVTGINVNDKGTGEGTIGNFKISFNTNTTNCVNDRLFGPNKKGGNYTPSKDNPIIAKDSQCTLGNFKITTNK
jgi:hypothetical protein